MFDTILYFKKRPTTGIPALTDDNQQFDADDSDEFDELDDLDESADTEDSAADDPQIEQVEVDPELEQEPAWPSDEKSRLQRLEAVLFISRKPLASRKLSQLAHLEDGTQARTMVKQLNQRYDRLGQAFHIKQVSGGFQFRTRPQFSDWIRRLEHIPRPLRLSNPAMETLTVVAYRQPIIKAEIEAIRGVSCGEMLRQLLETNLVKIAGRSEKLGRPFLYATSKDFLTCFGLNSLQELPRAKQLIGHGLPEWVTSDHNLVDTNVGENVLPDQPSDADPQNSADADSNFPTSGETETTKETQ